MRLTVWTTALLTVVVVLLCSTAYTRASCSLSPSVLGQPWNPDDLGRQIQGLSIPQCCCYNNEQASGEQVLDAGEVLGGCPCPVAPGLTCTYHEDEVLLNVVPTATSGLKNKFCDFGGFGSWPCSVNVIPWHCLHAFCSCSGPGGSSSPSCYTNVMEYADLFICEQCILP